MMIDRTTNANRLHLNVTQRNKKQTIEQLSKMSQPYQKKKGSMECTSFRFLSSSIHADKWRLVFLIILLAFIAHAIRTFKCTDSNESKINDLYLRPSLQLENGCTKWMDLNFMCVHSTGKSVRTFEIESLR